MLYKKIHRQFLREFRICRRLWFDGDVYRVDRKPYMYPGGGITVNLLNITMYLGRGGIDHMNCWVLICIKGNGRGDIRGWKNKITWID